MRIVCAMCLVALAVAAHAEEKGSGYNDFLEDPNEIRLGVLDASATTKVRLDGSDGRVGALVDLENDLGIDERARTLYASGSFRIYQRHFFELEYFDLRRSGLETLSTTINVGDATFERGAIVDSYFDSKFFRVSYAYLLRETENGAIGISLGLHVAGIEFGIEEVVPIGTFAENVNVAEVTAPLPVLGVGGGWRLAERLTLRARLQYFQLSVSDYSGSLSHASTKLEYRAFEHVGVGLGYDYFDIDVSADKTRWKGEARYRFHGPLLFLTANF